MRRNERQRGDIEGLLLLAILVALIGGLVALWIWAFTSSDKFSQWESDCHTAEGLVVKTSSDRYECYIDGKKVVLPGWENY